MKFQAKCFMNSKCNFSCPGPNSSTGIMTTWRRGPRPITELCNVVFGRGIKNHGQKNMLHIKKIVTRAMKKTSLLFLLIIKFIHPFWEKLLFESKWHRSMLAYQRFQSVLYQVFFFNLPD